MNKEQAIKKALELNKTLTKKIKWVAMDSDNRWFGHTKKPTTDNYGEFFESLDPKCLGTDESWKKTLTKI